MFEHLVEGCQCVGKPCSQCKEVKCHEAFYLDARGKYGRYAHCKACHSLYHQNKREHRLAGMKAYRESHQEDLKQKNRDHYINNKEHYQDYQRAYSASHREQIELYRNRSDIKERARVTRKEYDSRPGIQEKRRDRVRNLYRNHGNAYHYSRRPDVRVRKNTWTRNYRSRPEAQKHIQAYMRVYRSRPEARERHHIHDANRRARKNAASGTHTLQQIQELLKRQDYRCYYAACGRAKFEKRSGRYVYHIDHVIPLSRGGSNDISNLVLACPVCNLKKHNKYPWEFPAGGRLL